MPVGRRVLSCQRGTIDTFENPETVPGIHELAALHVCGSLSYMTFSFTPYNHQSAIGRFVSPDSCCIDAYIEWRSLCCTSLDSLFYTYHIPLMLRYLNPASDDISRGTDEERRIWIGTSAVKLRSSCSSIIIFYQMLLD